MKKELRRILAIILVLAMVLSSGTVEKTATVFAGETTTAAENQDVDESSEETTEVAAKGEEATEPSDQEGDQKETAEEGQTGENKETAPEEATAAEAATEDSTEDAGQDVSEEEKNSLEEVIKEEAGKEASYEKTEYVYEDKYVKVTARLSDPRAIPDDARLLVTPITAKSKGYDYDTYMDALNHSAKGSSEKYTDANTMLYDVAFITTQKDETGKDKEVELQPAAGLVNVNISFKKDQLTRQLGAKKPTEVEVKHLPLRRTVRNRFDTTKEAEKLEVRDVLVEDVIAEKTKLVGKDEVTFKVSNFSIVSVSSNSTSFKEADQTSSQVNYSLALGRAVEYGIVADTYDQTNHQQTNFAVKHFKNSGGGNGEPDLAGTHDVPYQIGSIDQNKLRFGTNTYHGEKVQYDVYLPDTYQSNIDNYVQVDGGSNKTTVNVIYESKNTITNNVESMINGASEKSQTLASHATTIDLPNSVVTDQNQLVVDTTSYPDDAVIYINVPATADYSMLRTVLSMQASFHLHKKSGQVVVMNIRGTDPVTLKKMIVTLPGEDINTKDENYSSFSPNGSSEQDNLKNTRIDEEIARKVIWNFPEATEVTLNTSAGVFLAPRADVTVTGTSAGWIVSGGTVTTDGCEFHFVYTDRHYTPQTPAQEPSRNLRFTVYKGLKDKEGREIGLNGRQFDFDLYETDSTFTTDSTPIQTAQNSAEATINFATINYTKEMIDNHNGDFYYVIKEKQAGSTLNGITNWDGQINIHLHPYIENDKITFKLTYYRYQSAADMASNIPENTVREIDVGGEEFTFSKVFNHYDAETSIGLKAKKVLINGTLTEGSHTFTLTEVADKNGTAINPGDNETVYSQTVTNKADGNIEFKPIVYHASDAATGTGKKHYYKIVETPGTDSSMLYDNTAHIVTVTVTDDGQGNLTAQADKNQDSIIFYNIAEKTNDVHNQISIAKKDQNNATIQSATFTLYDGETPIKTYEGGEFVISTSDIPDNLPAENGNEKVLKLKETSTS